MLSELSVKVFLDTLASDAPAPGGGSMAAKQKKETFLIDFAPFKV